MSFLIAHPETKPEGNAAVYGAAASIPTAIIEDVLRGYVDLKMKVKPRAGVVNGNSYNRHGSTH